MRLRAAPGELGVPELCGWIGAALLSARTEVAGKTDSTSRGWSLGGFLLRTIDFVFVVEWPRASPSNCSSHSNAADLGRRLSR